MENTFQPILYFCSQVVGSQARILYSDQRGRVALAQAFNKAINDGRLQVSILLTVRQNSTEKVIEMSGSSEFVMCLDAVTFLLVVHFTTSRQFPLRKL